MYLRAKVLVYKEDILDDIFLYTFYIWVLGIVLTVVLYDILQLNTIHITFIIWYFAMIKGVVCKYLKCLLD